MLRVPCGLPVIVAILQRLCDALKLRTFYSVQISCFRAPWTSQHSLQIWFYMLQLPCNLPMLASHCCKYYRMAKLRAMNWCCIMPCNVRVLAGDKYRAILRQILRSLEILTANDQHMVHQYFHTEVLSQKQVFTHAFTHTHAFTQDGFTPKYLHAQVFLHRDAFLQKLLHTDAWVLVHIDAFTPVMFWVLLMFSWCFCGVLAVFRWCFGGIEETVFFGSKMAPRTIPNWHQRRCETLLLGLYAVFI